MDADNFEEFLKSSDTLRVYKDDSLVFSSKKNMLLPLMEYIDVYENGNRDVIIFDKIIGNAAALLAIFARCGEVASPVGSKTAVATLERYGVKYRLLTVVDQVKQTDGKNCPMEELSAGKDPDGFYRIMKNMLGGAGRPKVK